MKNVCPICGFDKLKEAPFSKEGAPSYEICACCGFEFGFDEIECRDVYLKKWIEHGSKWFVPELKPRDWNLEEQLKNIP